MTDKQTLLALALTVESAEGGSRELDAAVFRAIGAPVPFQFANKLLALTFDESRDAYFADVGEMRVRYEPPGYTASIDAAMALVPEGAYPTIDFVTKRVWLRDQKGFDLSFAPAYGFAATVPLSICAAALRARAGGMA